MVSGSCSHTVHYSVGSSVLRFPLSIYYSAPHFHSHSPHPPFRSPSLLSFPLAPSQAIPVLPLDYFGPRSSLSPRTTRTPPSILSNSRCRSSQKASLLFMFCLLHTYILRPVIISLVYSLTHVSPCYLYLVSLRPQFLTASAEYSKNIFHEF